MKRFLSILILALSSVALTAQPFLNLYGGSGDEPAGFGSGYSGAPAVYAAYSADQHIYLLTYTSSSDNFINLNRGLDDIWVIKLALNGDTIWSKTYGGSDSERAYQIKVLSDNTIGICGKTYSNNFDFTGLKGGFDAFFLRINSNGEIIQNLRYGGSMDDAFYGFLEDDNNNFVLFGETGSVDGDIIQTSHAGSMEAWVIKINAQGQIAWQQLTSGLVNDSDWIETFWDGVKLPGSNGYMLMGVTGNFNDFNTDDILLVKINPVGDKDFVKVYGSAAQDAPGGIAVKGNEVFLTTRVSGASGDVTDYNGGGADVWVVKTDLEAEILWKRSYGGTDVEYPYGISVGNDGKVYVAAVTRSSNNFAEAWEPFGGFDAWLLQLESENGDTLLTRRIGGTDSDFAHYFLPIFDDSGYLVGRTRSNNGVVFGNNGGVDVFLSRVLYNQPLSLPPSSTFDFDIYPNPASDFITISIPENAAGTLEIRNGLGQLMKTESLTNPNQMLDISMLSTGFYTLSIADKNLKLVKKLVKQ